MSTTIETSTIKEFRGLAGNSDQDIEGDTCGEEGDWPQAFQELRRASGRAAGASSALLTKVIERDIIPRLFLAHREPAGRNAPERAKAPQPAPIDCELFTQMILGSETEEIMDQVQSIIDGGVTLRQVYLDLLAPVARRLGDFWIEDRCSFTDVTIGLARLHQVLRELGRRNGETMRPSNSNRRIYLVPTPGEQHTLGLAMVEEFFLHAGWETSIDHSADIDTIMRSLATQWIDVIGFTIGCAENFESMLAIVRQARAASANQNLKVMVGGRLFADQPDYIAKVGDLALVCDGIHAVEKAESLMSRTNMIDQTT